MNSLSVNVTQRNLLFVIPFKVNMVLHVSSSFTQPGEKKPRNVLYEAKTLHALDEQIYQAWILIISNSFKAHRNFIYSKVASSTRFMQYIRQDSPDHSIFQYCPIVETDIGSHE